MTDQSLPHLSQIPTTGINPWRCYKAHEAAVWLGLPDPRGGNKAIYSIPESDLPRRRIGPSRGRVRFLGMDLICYILGEPPMDLSTELDRIRAALQSPVSPKPLPHVKRSRVL